MLADPCFGSQWGPDPLLTPLGVKQALAVNSAWKEQLEDDVPLPQRLYSSPLIRSAATLNLTWSDILIYKEKGVTPLIREHLRWAEFCAGLFNAPLTSLGHAGRR